MSEQRCMYTWNPGVWPFIRRCMEPAVVKIFVEDDEIEVCATHDQLLTPPTVEVAG